MFHKAFAFDVQCSHAMFGQLIYRALFVTSNTNTNGHVILVIFFIYIYIESDKCLHKNVKYAVNVQTLPCDWNDKINICEYESTENDSL